jgi:hypothetical protein
MKTNHKQTEKQSGELVGHVVSFKSCPKNKSWALPEGAYRAIFEFSEVKNEKDVIHFRITSQQDGIYEYWARNCYRPEDRDKLRSHLLEWLGIEEFRCITRNEIVRLEELYGREADIFIKHLSFRVKDEPLRVIQKFAPPGALVPDSVLDQMPSCREAEQAPLIDNREFNSPFVANEI